MLRALFAAGLMALVSTPSQALQVQWTDWQSSSDANGFTAFGQMAKLGGGFIDVTCNNPQGVAFIQTGTGIDYFTPRTANSPYTSLWPGIGVDKAPPAAEMIALSRQGLQSLTFSEPVSNLFFSVVSLNGNGYRFIDQDFMVLIHTRADLDGSGVVDADGFWGGGTLTKNLVVEPGETFYELIGENEPHGTIRFSGSFDQISWESLTAENWNGFTVGIEGETAVVDPPPPPSGEAPLPPALALFAAALAGLGLAGRRPRAA
ncbi:MAG: PEP-CTERM sorting domain-containing protein [Pseudomonadota bacterium]